MAERPTTNTPVFAGIDIETTGLNTAPLDQGGDAILEIAVALFDADLRVVEHTEALVDFTYAWPDDQPGDVINRCGDIPRAMHFRNGLFEAINEYWTDGVLPDLRETENLVCDMFDRHGVTPDSRLPLLGNSPRSIDGPMVARDMPRLAERITHQTVDATTLRLLLEDRHGVRTPEAFDTACAAAGAVVDTLVDTSHSAKGIQHRALYDIICSAEQIREYEVLLADAVVGK